MKAWTVSDTSGDWTDVIFAPTRHEAFYKSDGYQMEGDYTSMRARRKKEWDQYAEQGEVPKEVMLADGWWFECYGRREDGRRCYSATRCQDSFFKKLRCETIHKFLRFA